MTRISFLVPTFNRARYLGEALGAICAQVGAEDDVVVIDDGSTDSTGAVAKAAGSRVRYLRQENAGKAVALNLGLAETDGHLIFICDDDDRLRPGAVDRLIAVHRSENVGFAFGRYTRFDDRNGRDIGVGYWPDLNSGSILRHLLEDAFVMQNAALIRRSALVAVGPFSESMKRSMDYEMFVRLACTFPARFIDTVMFEQRKHPGQRGPAALQHQASSSMRVWNRFDRTIFANFYGNVPITLFEAMFDGGSPETRRRAALLQRGVVMARHDCWEHACDDFDQAATIEAEPLDAGEYQICNRALAGKHGVGRLTEATTSRRLRSLRRRSERGREIVDAILAGGLWRLRSRDLGQASRVMKGLASIAGPSAVETALSHKSAKSRLAMIVERSNLPRESYLSPGAIPRVREEAP